MRCVMPDIFQPPVRVLREEVFERIIVGANLSPQELQILRVECGLPTNKTISVPADTSRATATIAWQKVKDKYLLSLAKL